ncbi:hypothetical protein FEF09_20630 [Chitinophaga pinensis]|uniref:WD40 repeat domain-containing protein n=1 Tax=Chitinophaga pinensis TaxID=79329 RepID=A0A5C6LN00_9BACT|nr:hypothetical protein FEF09_20630 [Chitinophaga pinensis]
MQKQRTILLALGLISLLIAASYVYSQWNKSEKSVRQIQELNHRLQSSADDLTKLNQSLNVTAEKARQSAAEANIARQKADSAAQQEKKARTIVERQKKELLIKQNALLLSQEEVKKYSLSLQAKADSLRTYSDSLKTQLVIIQNKTREVEYAKLTAAYLTKSRSLMHSDPAMAYQLALESLKYDSGNQKIKNYIHDTLDTRNTFYESFIVENVSSAFFADNGKTVLAIHGDNKFRLLDLVNHKDTNIIINGKILSAQFSPVDNSALIATRNNIFSYNANGVLRATSERMENVVKAVYTARGRIIVVTPAEVQIRKNVNSTTAVVIPSGNNDDDTEVSSNDSLLYIRKNDIIEAYDLTNGRLIRTYQEPNSFLAKGGNGFIAVSGKRLLLARSAGNKVVQERYFVPLEKDYSRVSIISIADNLRTLLFMAEPAEQQVIQQQQQVQQQQISKNFIRPQLSTPPVLYAFSLPKNSRKLPGNIPYARRVVLSENGNYIITGESGSLSIYDNNGYRVENFGGYANYTSWAFNPANTDMIMSMNGLRLKLWVKGTPDALSAQRKLRTFSSSELEKALEDIAIR